MNGRSTGGKNKELSANLEDNQQIHYQPGPKPLDGESPTQVWCEPEPGECPA